VAERAGADQPAANQGQAGRPPMANAA